MKKLFCVLVLAVIAFAQDALEEGEFIPGELAFFTTESSVVSDGGSFDFTVEAISAEPVFEIVEREEASDEAIVAEPVFEVVEIEKTSDIETVDEILTEEVAAEIAFEQISIESVIEEQRLENELPKILFTVNDNAQIICEFINSNEDKIIEIVSISEGAAVMEISADATEKLISIPSDKLNSGIYIVRVLSQQKKSSLFSKAVVIG